MYSDRSGQGQHHCQARPGRFKALDTSIADLDKWRMTKGARSNITTDGSKGIRSIRTTHSRAPSDVFSATLKTSQNSTSLKTCKASHTSKDAPASHLAITLVQKRLCFGDYEIKILHDNLS